MKKLYCFVVALLILGLIACANPEKQDFMMYMNQIDPLSTIEEACWTTDSSNWPKNNTELYAILTTELPTCKAYLNAMEVIQPQTIPVINLHFQHKMSYRKLISAYTLAIEAIEAQDSIGVRKANAQIMEAAASFSIYALQLIELNHKYGLIQLPGVK